MAAPSLPSLAFNVNSQTVSASSIDKWLDALYTALTATTYDDSSSVPTTARWQVSRYQNAGTTEAVYAEPASTSPVAGKVVLIWAAAAAGTHSSVVMASPDTYANGVIIFGAYVANAGTTISRSNFSSWDGATPFTSGGRFTGYTRLYAGTAWDKCFLFSSDDYIITQLYTTTANTSHVCGGGFGIRGLDDGAVLAESGLGGRLFDFFTTGSSGAFSSTFWSQSSASLGVFTHSTNAAQTHSYVLIPGGSTLKAIRIRDNAGTSSFNDSSSTNCYGIDSTTIEPEILPFRDTTGNKIGRHRAIFYGPRRTTKAILSDSGVKKWIMCGYSTTTQGDCFAMPM